MRELSKFEETFPIKPIGVKYICEHCGEGEMISNSNVPVNHVEPLLFPHKCDKCGKGLSLPRVYPYIEWIKE